MVISNIDEITKDDLQALIDNEVLEKKTIEYKRLLPSNSDSDKKEFLADVTSLANASGGDLIFGIAQDNTSGLPTELLGIEVTNVDTEKTRLDNLVRTGIQPRLPSVNIKEVPLENSRFCIVIRVSKSWISPHRVVLGGHDKFYSRNSSGKYPLDVGELRIAFNLSETITERIRNFRIDRISKIIANETPLSTTYNAKIALHLLPISSFYQAQNYDISHVTSAPGRMPPINSHGCNGRYNLDGFMSYSGVERGELCTYVQLFRNGIIEAVEGYLLRPHRTGLYIPSTAFEDKLITSLSSYLSILKELDVDLPIFSFLTLINVKDYSMGIDPARFIIDDVYTIDRDVIVLPETIIENYEEKSESILKPSFDSIWNACGFRQSFNYNELGEWAPR